MSEPEKSRINWLLIGAVAILILTLVISSQNSSVEEVTAPVRPDPINSISELPDRVADIQALAYYRMKADSAEPVENPMPIELLVPPGSDYSCVEDSIEILRNIENAFKRTLLPRSLTVLFGDAEGDKQWLRETTGKLLEPKFRSYADGEEINPETVNDKGDGVVWSLNPCSENGSLSGEEQIQLVHGFAHVIQTTQFISTEKHWGRWGELPRWILEGGATFVHNYWNNRESLDLYKNNTENLYENSAFDEKFYLDFLKYDTSFEQLWQYTDQWPNQRAYDVGSYVCQVLVALKGPESISDIYGEYLRTEDFNQSFKNIYGMTWDEAHPIFAKVIYEMIQLNKPF
ncbi:MAG: hypothetical protein RLZZ79_71 [Actinomycetota bacterium]|jgi:hypothetical protein